jgi:hypothetical protein
MNRKANGSKLFGRRSIPKVVAIYSAPPDDVPTDKKKTEDGEDDNDTYNFDFTNKASSRSVGELATDSDLAAAVQVVSGIQVNEIALVHRSDKTWRYARLSQRSEDCMTFVMDSAGQEKVISQQWWSEVRRLELFRPMNGRKETFNNSALPGLATGAASSQSKHESHTSPNLKRRKSRLGLNGTRGRQRSQRLHGEVSAPCVRQKPHTEGIIQEIETLQVFDYDTANNTWSSTGKFQNTVIYQVFEQLSPLGPKSRETFPAEKLQKRRSSIRKGAFEEVQDVTAKNAQEDAAKKCSEAAAATTANSNGGWTEHTNDAGKKYYYHKVTNKTHWTKPEEFRLSLQVPENAGGQVSKIPQQKTRERRVSMRLRTKNALDTATPIPVICTDNNVVRVLDEAEAVPLAAPLIKKRPEPLEVKTALERGNLISKTSSKFRYCWEGTETVLERRGSGCSRGKKAHDKKRRRNSEGMIPSAALAADLRAAYAELAYDVDDISELSHLYSRERMSLQKMLIKAVYTVSRPTDMVF